MTHREARLRALATAIANHYLESKEREDRFDTLGENHQLAWLNNAGAALSALEATDAAAGMVLVPREPTGWKGRRTTS